MPHPAIGVRVGMTLDMERVVRVDRRVTYGIGLGFAFLAFHRFLD